MRSTRPPTPTDYATLRTVPVRQLPYRLPLRVHDWWAGRRDGRIDLTGLERADRATAAGQLTAETSVWIAHNAHREQERHHYEDLAHRARTVHLEIRHKTDTADLDTAQIELDTAIEQLDTLPPATSDALNSRGAAETRTPAAVIAQRRGREHDRSAVAPARARVTTAQARVTALTGELHELAAQLDTLQNVTTTRQARISELHERRSAVYRRAYLRAHQQTTHRAARRAARRRSTRSLPPPEPISRSNR